MKRIWTVITGISLLALLLAACGSQKAPVASVQSEPKQSTVAEATTAPETAATASVAESTQSPEVSEEQAAQTIAADTAPAVETPATPAGEITETEAKNIALTDAGVAEADVTAIRVKLDVDHGVREYEVEFYVGNMEYDYEIDAQSGAIVSMDAEIEDDFKPSKDSKSTQKTQDIQTVETALSEDDAIAIVLDEVPDATESDVRIHLEFDDGRYVYDASVVLGLTEYELEIDANDGTVLKWEKDSIFD